jgi:hypothetical protein
MGWFSFFLGAGIGAYAGVKCTKNSDLPPAEQNQFIKTLKEEFGKVNFDRIIGTAKEEGQKLHEKHCKECGEPTVTGQKRN